MLRLTDTRVCGGVRPFSRRREIPRSACAVGRAAVRRLIVLERRTLKIHAEFRCPARVSFDPEPHQMRSRRPARIRLEAQQPRRFGKHRPRVGLAKPSPFSRSRSSSALRRPMSASLSPFARVVAEMTPAVDHLFRRAATDAQLQIGHRRSGRLRRASSAM